MLHHEESPEKPHMTTPQNLPPSPRHTPTHTHAHISINFEKVIPLPFYEGDRGWVQTMVCWKF